MDKAEPPHISDKEKRIAGILRSKQVTLDGYFRLSEQSALLLAKELKNSDCVCDSCW